MKPTALETLQPQTMALEVPKPEEFQPDILQIGDRETAPATLRTLAEKATKTALTAFEELASTPPEINDSLPGGAKTHYWTNKQNKTDYDFPPGS